MPPAATARGPVTTAPASGSRRSFLIVFQAMFAMLLASNLPAPLYAVYGRKFGFSDTELTLIFITYAVVLMPSLIVFGQLSDRFGRRPVIAAGLVGAGISLVLFAAAQGTVWLFFARGVQGFATGVLTAAATAALVELEPHGDHGRAAATTVLGTNGGSAVAPLIAGILAEWAPWPLVLCYLVAMVVVALALARVLTIDEPVTASGTWSLELPRVAAPVRGPFARAALTGAVSWSTGGLFLSLVPSYAGDLLRTGNLALLGAITALMLGVSAVVQLGLQRTEVDPVDLQPIGSGGPRHRTRRARAGAAAAFGRGRVRVVGDRGCRPRDRTVRSADDDQRSGPARPSRRGDLGIHGLPVWRGGRDRGLHRPARRRPWGLRGDHRCQRGARCRRDRRDRLAPGAAARGSSSPGWTFGCQSECSKSVA